MNVPLLVMENDSSISVVRNGEIIEVPFDLLPSKPYVLIETSENDPAGKKYKDLATKAPVTLIREEFPTSRAAVERFNSLKTGRRYHTRILEQTLLDHPDFLTSPIYRQTDPIRISVMDIEVLSDGSGIFPRPARVPIISIAVLRMTVDNDGVHLGDRKVFMDFSTEYQDRKILAAFLADYKEWNPDIVAGYNHRGFDIPYTIQRLAKYKTKEGKYPTDLYPGILTRTGELPFARQEEDEGDDGTIHYDLQGRITMDLYDNVISDQSLNGVDSFKLKTILKHFKYTGNEIVELDTKDMRPYVNTPILGKYNISDVMGAGDKLLRNYLPCQMTLAEMMKLPLDLVINGYSSTIPKISTGRRCLALGLIPLDNNELRYGDTRFEAAYVDIFKTGRFENIYKYDVSSMYPSIMITFNLGPDTTKMCTMDLPYDENKFSITKGKDQLLIEVPDKNFKRNLLISVDIDRNSFVREDLTTLFNERQRTKKEMKKVAEGTPEWISLNSTNWAVKICANATFGFHGLKYAKFGDMAVGVATVAIGRWLIKEILKIFGDNACEIDTDGCMVIGEFNADEINARLDGLVSSASGQKNYIKIEKEGPWTAYFYRAKNYALKKPKKDGDFIYELHGGALKGKKHCEIARAAVRTVAKAVLDGQSNEELKELVMKLRNLETYKLDQFLLHVSLGKTDYKENKAMQVVLMEQAKAALKRSLRSGDTIDYFKTKEGYKIVDLVKSIDELDHEYYHERVEKVQSLFGLEDIHKTPEELVRERRRAKVLRLMRRKAALSKEPTANHLIEFTDLKTLSRKEAADEVANILVLQEAMSKKWPCPNCKGIGYEIEYPSLRCLGCGWTGNPVKPVKRKPLRKQKEVRPDGSVLIKIGEEVITLPADWRTRRMQLEEKYETAGHLTKDEWDIVQYGKETTKKAKETSDVPSDMEDVPELPEVETWTCEQCGRTYSLEGRKIRECPRCPK